MSTKCTVEGCGKWSFQSGLCRTHASSAAPPPAAPSPPSQTPRQPLPTSPAQSHDSSVLHMDECACQTACMAFPASIRAKVSTVLRANHEEWSALSWARRLELVQAQAVSLRDASAAAFEGLLASTTSPDFSADLPSCSDVILSCASSPDDLCITLKAVEQPRRKPIHCIVVLDVSGSMDHSATQSAPQSAGESQVKFTRLDLAKHSSKVIIEVMGDGDYVSIISFGSEANIQLQAARATQEGAHALN
jgi:hypothetical protein